MFPANRVGARLFALAVVLILSGSQSRFFDCNKLPVLSVAGTIVTLVLLYGVAEKTYDVVASEDSGRAKFAAGIKVILVGTVLVMGVGFFTVMTHLCP